MLALLAAATLTLEIPLHVHVALPSGALERALAEADRLYQAGEIRFDWKLSPDVPIRPAPGGLAAISILARPERPVVSGCSRNLHDHRLGRAELEARRVTLWTEQVARAVAGSWDRKDAPRVDPTSLGTALGRVLAHELGHLLLRLDGHRGNGLMTPSFSQRALTGTSDRSFRLSAEDLERVKGALTRLRIEPR